MTTVTMGKALNLALHDALERGPIHQRAGRIVRLVDIEHPSRRAHESLERLRVVGPALLVAPVPGADLGAGAAGHLERRLVARRLDDRVIARPEQRVVEQEDALLGA